MAEESEGLAAVVSPVAFRLTFEGRMEADVCFRDKELVEGTLSILADLSIDNRMVVRKNGVGFIDTMESVPQSKKEAVPLSSSSGRIYIIIEDWNLM